MDLEKRTIMMLVNNISKCFRDKMRVKTDELGLVDTYRPIFWVLKNYVLTRRYTMWVMAN